MTLLEEQIQSLVRHHYVDTLLVAIHRMYPKESVDEAVVFLRSKGFSVEKEAKNAKEDKHRPGKPL